MNGRNYIFSKFCTRIACEKILVGLRHKQIRPEVFNFSFYRPDRPEFSKIEKKIKVLFFNFIFRDRSDSPKKKKRAG